ncbi:MAG: hypothetical protein GEV13_18775 [Rhodospirillales bacterium]|nr:hypothetical protein [Rhodospirillales bacterium]
MAGTHVADLQSLISRMAPKMGDGVRLECKRFFSGAAAYADGRIFMTLTPAGLALKLPEHGRATLMAAGGRPLRYFPNAPVKKEYVLCPSELGDEALAHWIALSVTFVQRKP